MKFIKLHFILTISLSLGIANCISQDKHLNRQPAVAGKFYPADSSELYSSVKVLFARATPSKHLDNVVAVIVPHAGYIFSGEVAASGFNQIDPSKEYENIFIIGSSHHVSFEGASIYHWGNFITPLGKISVNTTLAKKLIKQYAVFTDRIDAHLNEHSIEVQLPFLQCKLKKSFKIVPIILGTQKPDVCNKIGEALLPFLNSKNLFIISTDFSHYPSYNDAVRIDKATAEAIMKNSFDTMITALQENEMKRIPNLSTSLCGWTSVLTLLSMTELNTGVSFNNIQYKNSGDTETGDKRNVVGYNAIAVSLNRKNESRQFFLRDDEKKELLSIARNTIEQYISKHKFMQIDVTALPENLKTACGAFVTLHKNHELRGCIGRFEALEPLYKVVQQMAIAASTEDYRFSPVTADEINQLVIEISVLTPMRKINSIDEIELGKHGIYIRKDARSGTFLPQVATETGWSKEEFLGHCAQDKAGIGWNGWRDADLYVYEAYVFSEK